MAAAGQAPSSPASPVAPPKNIKRVEPEYPDKARRARIAGVVFVRATIGPDGKVRDAVVVQSIPLLDEAALAAVRQWEYEPTIIDGVARTLTMTVRVEFHLSELDGSERAPLIVSRNATGWTLNGTSLPDDNLQERLRGAYVNELLIVDVRVAHTYADLVEMLASAAAAGLPRLSVFDGRDPKHAVRVALEPVSGPEPDVRLPTAAIVEEPVKTDLEITLRRGATLARTLTAMRRARKGAVVRLRADGGRSAADVWRILQAGRAAGVDLFALAIRVPD